MKLKKTLMSIFALAATGLIITPIATSCSDVSSDIIDNLINKGDSSKFSDVLGTDIKSVFKEALKSKAGYDAFKAKLVDDVLYAWYKDKKDTQSTFKDNWNKWEKQAKKDYDDKVSSYKDSHRNDWPYYFQNEVLDPVGGTKDAFIRDKICQSIRTEFTDIVFSSDDLRLAASPIESYSYDERLQTWNGSVKGEIDKTENWKKIDFFSSVDPLYMSNPLLANQYAKMQKYVFDQYMNKIRPISTAMCLWKYSAETNQMANIYNSHLIPSDGGSSSNDDATTGLKESYEFPCFKPANGPLTNETTASDLYFEFANLWKSYVDHDQTPFIEDEGSTKVGKINIPKNLTEDSATLMITESNSAFSSLDVSFAGVVGDLWRAYGTGNSEQTNIKKYHTNELIIPENIQDTDILSNFLFANGHQPNGSYTIDLSDLYSFNGEVSQQSGTIKNFSSFLFNQQSSYAYHDGKEGIRYVVPAVRLQVGTEALPMVMIRDSFGVHVIGLDCADYIANYKVGAENKQWEAEGNVLKYRSLMESHELGNQGTGMVLNSKLKDFFKNNLDDIVLGILKDGTKAHIDSLSSADSSTEKEIFDKDVWGSDISQQILDLVTNANMYYAYYNLISTIDEANKKLFDNSSKYVTNSLIRKTGNITSDIYKNGLACALPFVLTSGDPSNTNDEILLETDNYDCTNVVYGFDDYYLGVPESHTTIGSMTSRITSSFLNELLDDLSTAVENYWNTAQVSPNKSTNGSLKYSEHIIVERGNSQSEDTKAFDAINFTFNAFGASGNDMSNIIKYKTYEQYIQNDVSTLETEFSEPLTSIYKTNKVISDTTPLSYYKNAALPTSRDYIDLINSIYKSNLNRSITTNAQTFSSDSLDYELTLATLKWLTDNNYKELLNQLRNSIPYFSSAAVVWNQKDLIDPYNRVFRERCVTNTNFNDVFGFKANYLGLYDNRYQSTNSLISGLDSMDGGFISNSYYYHFAPMPYYISSSETSPEGQTKSYLPIAMSFVGIQTSSSSPELDSEVSDIIFSRNNKHLYNSVENAASTTLGDKGEGSLYQYGSIENLKSLIENNHSIESIKSYALAIENAIPDNSDYELIVSQIKNGKDSEGKPLSTWEQYSDLLLSAFESTSERDPIITSDMFKGFNFGDNGLGGVQLKSNDTAYDSAIKLSSGGYARTYMIQFSKNDLIGDDETVSKNLIKIFGGTPILGAINVGKTILDTIAVQYALKSNVQSSAITDIIKEIYNGKKIKVFDRRFNDQLGDTWVYDWKHSN